MGTYKPVIYYIKPQILYKIKYLSPSPRPAGEIFCAVLLVIHIHDLSYGVVDHEVRLGIVGRGLLVDQHHVAAPEIPDESGSRVHHQGRASHDQKIRLGDY